MRRSARFHHLDEKKRCLCALLPDSGQFSKELGLPMNRPDVNHCRRLSLCWRRKRDQVVGFRRNHDSARTTAQVRNGKNNRSICLHINFSISAPASSGLAGYCRLIWPNLCTRHILFGLKPRGHHDWPYKATTWSMKLPLIGVGASSRFWAEFAVERLLG